MAGCTAIVALLVGKKLFVSNAGDSRGVLCRKGGVAFPLSKDHKPTQERELTRISLAGGFVNLVGRINGNLNLSRSLGDLKYKQNPALPMSQQVYSLPHFPFLSFNSISFLSFLTDDYRRARYYCY
jgi:serine/threonine protein phosphatase PrpC